LKIQIEILENTACYSIVIQLGIAIREGASAVTVVAVNAVALTNNTNNTSHFDIKIVMK
jgi:hypothetical protein